MFLEAYKKGEKGANGTWNRNKAALHEEMSQFNSIHMKDAK